MFIFQSAETTCQRIRGQRIRGRKSSSFINLLAGGVVSLIAVQTAHAAAPKPGPMESYRDWIIGCDNINDCTAASLTPGEGNLPEQVITLYIHRAAGPDTRPEIEITLSDTYDGPVDLLVDGVAYATALMQGGKAIVAPDKNSVLIRASVRGMALNLRHEGKIIGSASLSGLSAALRYMDAQQGRAGTVTALVATGTLSASSVRRAEPAPIVYYAPVPEKAGQPASLWREERSKALAISDCGAEQDPAQEAQIARLSDREELVLVPCGSGAYNFSTVPLIASGQPGRRSFALARFDSPPGWGEGPAPMLVNAAWDAKKAMLSSYMKGRGLGDCGSMERYVWDGSVFRLIEQRAMKECRGAWQWIRLWQATPLIRAK